MARRTWGVVRATSRKQVAPITTCNRAAANKPEEQRGLGSRRFRARLKTAIAMFRRLLEQRAVLAMLLATGVGVLGVHTYPIDRGNVYLQLIELRSPAMFLVLVYGYATLWFTTPFFALSIVASLVTIVAYRYPAGTRAKPLPAYVPPERRPSPTLVLGEAHFETTSGRAPAPTWLTIPQRGLYTGVIIVGAVGTGKTSACMYPYAEQLLRWRAGDPDRKIGGLVLEVKGDFCQQVRGMLRRAGRESDYAEIRLGGDICYNPLHNDLDPYAVAFAIATLVNNLFGKSKEPFWQQAYTDLLKFVILLRRLVDGYTTFAEVYRYILEDSKIESEISALKATLTQPPEVIVVPLANYELQVVGIPWTNWFQDGPGHMAHQYSAELESALHEQQVPFEVRRAKGTAWIERKHQLDAVARWFTCRRGDRWRWSAVTSSTPGTSHRTRCWSVRRGRVRPSCSRPRRGLFRCQRALTRFTARKSRPATNRVCSKCASRWAWCSTAGGC